MNDTLKTILKNLLKPSTIFAFMIYYTFLHLSITGKIEPNSVENAFLILISFYFGKAVTKRKDGE